MLVPIKSGSVSHPEMKNMKYNSSKLVFVVILIIASLLRFYNLLHDSPYFFNPDERNMAIAISRFRLPKDFTKIPSCLIREASRINIKQQDSSTPPEEDKCNLNPHFFSYGQFPLYLAYISDQTVKKVSSLFLFLVPSPTVKTGLETDFPSAIFWLRFYSFLSSTLIVWIVYKITEKLTRSNFFSLLASLFTAFTPGLIQAAHFGTTESLLTFFFVSSVYFAFNFFEKTKTRSAMKFLKTKIIDILIISVIIGLSFGTKFTGIMFMAPPFIALLIKVFNPDHKKNWLKWTAVYTSIALFIALFSLVITILSSPYNLIEYPSFISAVFGYEKDVATGRYEAFYTRQFINTTPVLFQINKIFPYTLGLPILITGSLGLLLLNLQLIMSFARFIHQIVRKLIKSRRNKKIRIVILNSELISLVIIPSILIYFVPNAFLYAKWTRFMTPLLPFFSIFAAFALFQIYLPFRSNENDSQEYYRRSEIFSSKFKFYILAFAFCTPAILPGIAYMSIYVNQDSRVQSSYAIYKEIPNNSYILSETANVIDIPVGIPNMNIPPRNYTVISFDFYNLDEVPSLFNDLTMHLEKADYILIPSRRIFANYLLFPRKFPLVTKYYQLLFSGQLGFAKIDEISSFPQISLGNLKWEFPDENAEETWTVFDHPVIRIYKKTKSLTRNDYRNLLLSNSTK